MWSADPLPLTPDRRLFRSWNVIPRRKPRNAGACDAFTKHLPCEYVVVADSTARHAKIPRRIVRLISEELLLVVLSQNYAMRRRRAGRAVECSLCRTST